MIERILNKYIDFTKIIAFELHKSDDFYYIEIHCQLLEKPIYLYLGEFTQSENENKKIESEFNKALLLWENINSKN